MHRRYYLPVVSFVILFVFTKSSCHKSLPDTQLGNWIGAAPIPQFPRGFASSFVIGNEAYVGLGVFAAGNPMKLSDFYSFDVNKGWTQLANFPGPVRSNAASFSLDNFGYVGTGLSADGITPLSDFYQYDPTANVWSVKAPFPGVARYDAVGFGLQHLGYIGTGMNINRMNDFYQYDPSTNSWAGTPGTSGDFAKRSGGVAFVYNNQAYIVTGSTSGGMAGDFWSFDPSRAQPWKQLNNITNSIPGSFDAAYTDIKRQYATAFVNGTTAYLTLGQNGTMVTSTWAYDFVQDLWTRRTPYPRTGRYGALSFTIGQRSFVGSGTDGNTNFYDDFVEFLPDQPYNPSSLVN